VEPDAEPDAERDVSALVVLGVLLAGGLGAMSRFVVDAVVRARTSDAYPVATAVINVTGSFVLGLVTGLVLAHAAPEGVRSVIGTGFLGGYTTFSTASFETVRLMEQGRVRAALGYGLGTLIATVGVAALGLWLGLLAGP
jgi:CrcB protein